MLWRGGEGGATRRPYVLRKGGLRSAYVSHRRSATYFEDGALIVLEVQDTVLLRRREGKRTRTR